MSETELSPWIEGYLEYKEKIIKQSRRTVADIRCTLKKVTVYAKKNHSDKEIWGLDFDQYLKWLEGERLMKKSVKTLSKDISHIRGFLNYMMRNEKCSRNVLDGFHLHDNKEKMPDFLELGETADLIESLPVKTKEDRRNRLMILILYGCGLRTNELCGLDIKDIDTEMQELHIRHAKGDLERQVPVPDGVWIEMLAYLGENRWQGGPLFRTSVKRKRINDQLLGKVLSEKVLRAGFTKKVTPKTLRHTFATHLMDIGVDLAVIASLMGHRSVRETGVYLHHLEGRKENAIKSMRIFEDKEGNNNE
jgi:integrase/recombinase XerD